MTMQRCPEDWEDLNKEGNKERKKDTRRKRKKKEEKEGNKDETSFSLSKNYFYIPTF